jgi:hypothetical protein
MADALEISRAIDLGDQERIEARLYDGRKVVERKTRVERIDAHDERPGASRLVLDQSGDMGAGGRFFSGRDGIFEVKDQGVGPAIFCPRELAFRVAGNEQERAQSHVAPRF